MSEGGAEANRDARSNISSRRLGALRRPVPHIKLKQCQPTVLRPRTNERGIMLAAFNVVKRLAYQATTNRACGGGGEE
jgi:hypothetical protein